MTETFKLSMKLAAAAMRDLQRTVGETYFWLLFAFRPRTKGETDCPYPHDTTTILNGFACPACGACV